MKVILPDRSELELPEGATGLDAARAIGPKLAEQAVLLRSNGVVQDLRRPLEDGQEIQILTTRDAQDPDALAVLRHSAAHLLAEAVRRLYPGVKVAIGPPVENGFYYDFEFPEPITEADLPPKDGRGSAGRSTATRRDGCSRKRASATRSSSSRRRTGRSPSTARGTSSTSAAARTSRSRARSRRSSSRAWRAPTGAATSATRS
jgi:TGS domain-containing protein